VGNRTILSPYSRGPIQRSTRQQGADKGNPTGLGGIESWLLVDEQRTLKKKSLTFCGGTVKLLRECEAWVYGGSGSEALAGGSRWRRRGGLGGVESKTLQGSHQLLGKRSQSIQLVLIYRELVGLGGQLGGDLHDCCWIAVWRSLL